MGKQVLEEDILSSGLSMLILKRLWVIRVETSRKWKHSSVAQESPVGKAVALGLAVEDKQNHTSW